MSLYPSRLPTKTLGERIRDKTDSLKAEAVELILMQGPGTKGNTQPREAAEERSGSAEVQTFAKQDHAKPGRDGGAPAKALEEAPRSSSEHDSDIAGKIGPESSRLQPAGIAVPASTQPTHRPQSSRAAAGGQVSSSSGITEKFRVDKEGRKSA
ncbi:hypothetical protein B0H19DRAFT_1074885 [Mycena capillaripes]|nr:hypothetical protein B0H19DRAFT_1074885 [Mycena capillaripes]